MSAIVKLSSKLPGDPEINGLDARRGDLVDDPEAMLVCIAYVDTSKVVIDTDTGDHIPTVRIRRIEPLGSVSEVPQAVRDAMGAAESERTGRTPIPFETVVVGEAAWSDELDAGDDS